MINKPEIVHLHNHSYYSLLDGMTSPKQMVQAAVDNGWKALAITDHGSCGGLFSFQKACLEKGIKPILGIEAYITENINIKDVQSKTYHLNLLAKNHNGLKNIMRLCSIAEIQGKYRKPRIDFDILSKHNDGLICTTACPIGQLPNLLWEGQKEEAILLANKYKDIFKDDYYIEIMMHKYFESGKEQEEKEKELVKKLYAFSKENNIKAICTNDSHYAKKSDASFHDVLLSIQTHDVIKNPDRFSFCSDDFYLKSAEEMFETYSWAPELLKNTIEIAEKVECNNKGLLSFSEDLLPNFSVPDGYANEIAYLKALVTDGMKEKNLINKPEYRERIKMEMSAITDCNFVRYFLILWDIINFAKQQNIRVGIGRGCFLPGNKIECKDGEKRIEDVNIGDNVLAYDGKFHTVSDNVSYDIKEKIIDIVLKDGRKISCTYDHKIHIKRNNKLKWIKAEKLTPQDIIYDINTNKEPIIKHITNRMYIGKVYDLTVKDLHAYNIEGLSVHNSAVGSLCLYTLGITKLDPIQYDLLFERFINRERISPPDVDIDFDYFRRDEIFDYVYRKYGNDYCSKIGTYNKLKAKAVIRYATKALDLGNDWERYLKAKSINPKAKLDETKHSLELSDFIAKLIPETPNLTLEDVLRDEADFRNQMNKYPYLLEVARHLENTVASAGVHPAGIVVCKNPIADYIPLRESKEQICSQFDGPEVENLGLLKFDFLALKTLTVVDETIKLIEKRHNKKINIDNIEANDPKVFALLNGAYRSMDNRGIFQFENRGISKLLKDIHVDSFEDMIVANALYRPGPLGAGVQDLYCDYKHKRKEIKPLHPKMEQILKKTYGIMVFQENLMKVAQELAGFTLGQADILRKVVGKKKIELIKKENLDNLFYDGCLKNGIDRETSEKIFEQIKYFGEYGFNRSHSAAYGFLAYQTAFLKVYYPIEFMCSLLTSELSNSDKDKKMKSYLEEAQRMGIVIMQPDINKSGLKFSIETGERVKDGSKYDCIRIPLTYLKGVKEKAVSNIVENQPFKSLKDFIYKIDGRRVNSKVFESLVNAGCMESAWKVSKSMLLNKYKEVKESVDKMKKNKKKELERDDYLESVGGSLFDRIDDSEVKI